MIMTHALTPFDDQRCRGFMLLMCGILQLSVYGVALFVGSHHLAPPWPTVVTFGAVLGQCCLAAAFVVFGPWLLPIRSLVSAAVVVIGGLLILAASEAPLRSNDVMLFSLCALLMWGLIQAPLWVCRYLLRARLVIGAPTEIKAAHQYGIRQLMGLTFAVAVVLG